MPLRYDLLVIDLDGTLLDGQGRVPPANARAIQAARDAGLEVIVATGRALVESVAALDAIGRSGVVITAGGSMTCCAVSEATLDRHAMSRTLVAEAADALVGDGHKALLLKDAHAVGYDYLAVGAADLDPASEWWFHTLPVRVRFVDSVADDPDPDDTVRLGAVATAGELAPLAARLGSTLGDRAFLQHWGAVTASEATGSETHLLEIFDPAVNKWTMVERLCSSREIDPSRVAAIGDGLNDVELIRGAGLGIAMANADPRVHAEAQRVTGHHRDAGVAHAIAQLLEGTW